MRFHFVVPALSLLVSGCDSSHVGDPCLPEEEYGQDFGGFSVDETSVETRSLQCASRICLVNHFQGRASCPYGQSGPGGSERCLVPGTDVGIDVPVKAWNVTRPPDAAVYCSCRCDGPDPGADYCTCPSGFACAKLIDELDLGANELSGSYCIKDGTRYAVTDGAASSCREDPSHAGCPHVER